MTINVQDCYGVYNYIQKQRRSRRNDTVKYYKKTSQFIYEPFACTKKELKSLLADHDDLKWCADCRAVVEYETKLKPAIGLVNVCPYCGR